jgi:hypothetical protein
MEYQFRVKPKARTRPRNEHRDRTGYWEPPYIDSYDGYDDMGLELCYDPNQTDKEDELPME